MKTQWTKRRIGNTERILEDTFKQSEMHGSSTLERGNSTTFLSHEVTNQRNPTDQPSLLAYSPFNSLKMHYPKKNFFLGIALTSHYISEFNLNLKFKLATRPIN